MGEVWKARQQGIGRWVAVKVLHPQFTQDEEYVQRFLREARTAGRLAHECIVRAYDCGQAGGRNYLVMEFIEGRALDRILAERKTLPEREALLLVRRLAQALQHAWELKIVHRDVKPQNVLVTPDGTPKLCDLGLSRDVSAATRLTMTGSIACTPAYASPEQANGETAIDTRTDLYSLGVLLYELVTGELPFRSSSPAALLVKHATEVPRPPAALNSKLSAGTNRLILDLLEKLPSKRPTTPAVVVSRIDGLLEGKEAAPKTSRTVAPRRSRSFARGSSGFPVAAVAGGVSALVFIVLAVSLSGGKPPPSPPPPSNPERPVLTKMPVNFVNTPEPAKPAPAPAPEPPKKDPAEEHRKAREEVVARVREAAAEKHRDAPWAAEEAAQVAEIRKAAQALYAPLATQAAEAAKKGDVAALEAIRKRIASWGMPGIEQAFEGLVAASTPAAKPRPAPAPAPPPPPAPVARPKPPDSADRARIRTSVRSIFKADYAKTSPEDVRALSAKLLEGARRPDADAVTRYVLLEEARNEAVRAGHATGVFAAVEEITAGFDVDARREWTDALGKLRSTTRDAAPCLERARTAILMDDYDLAAELLKTAQAAAGRSGDAGAAASLLTAMTDLQGAREAHRAAQKDLEKLKGAPDDPDANLSVGRFHCIAKGDWTRGVEHRADAWLQTSGDPFREHAYDLYQSAWPGLAGERRDRVRQVLLGRIHRGVVRDQAPQGWYIGKGTRRELYRVDGTRSRAGASSLRVDACETEGRILTEQTPEWDLCSVFFYAEPSQPPIGVVHLKAPADQPWWTPLRARVKIPPA
jgi:serine/threonine protein kinase